LAILTVVRRLLILLCIVGILVCLVLWLAVDRKIESSGSKNKLTGSLKILTKTPDEASKMLEALKATGIKAQVKSEEGQKDKLKGYVVVASFPSDSCGSVAEYLRGNKYNATVKEDTKRSGYSILQVGNVYPGKAQAEALAKRIANELEVKFKAEAIYEKVPARLHFLLIEDIDEKKAEELEEKFKDKAEDINWIPNS